MADNDSAIRTAVARSMSKYKISAGEGHIEVRAYYASEVDNGSSAGMSTKRIAAVMSEKIRDRMIAVTKEIQVSAGQKDAVVENISAKSYDISVEPSDDERKVLAIPSEDAWLNPVNFSVYRSGISDSQKVIDSVFGNQEILQLPVNAVDIVYIVNKNRGNTKAKA
jgi:hypothetical protein